MPSELHAVDAARSKGFAVSRSRDLWSLRAQRLKREFRNSRLIFQDAFHRAILRELAPAPSAGRLLRHQRARPSAALDKATLRTAKTYTGAGRCQPPGQDGVDGGSIIARSVFAQVLVAALAILNRGSER